MGKKRRIQSAKAKFASKHRNHPRMRLLAEDSEDSTTATVSLPTSAIEVAPADLKTPPTAEAKEALAEEHTTEKPQTSTAAAPAPAAPAPAAKTSKRKNPAKVATPRTRKSK